MTVTNPRHTPVVHVHADVSDVDPVPTDHLDLMYAYRGNGRWYCHRADAAGIRVGPPGDDWQDEESLWSNLESDGAQKAPEWLREAIERFRPKGALTLPGERSAE